MNTLQMGTATQMVEDGDVPFFIGQSTAVLSAVRYVHRIAVAKDDVLISGETGTGKDLMARLVYHCSGRRGGPFVRVNCATLAAGLAGNELFGHAAGSFTGATRQASGLVSGADGGTLFLNEIDSLAMEVQAQLLSFLDHRAFNPLGCKTAKNVDVRVIVATNADLRQLVCDGRFRHDLYFRLKQFTIHLPPLRERACDIGILAEHFLEEASREAGEPVKVLTSSAHDKLSAYQWPGNVRELRSVIRKASTLSSGGVIEDSDLEIDSPVESVLPDSYKSAMAASARSYFNRVLGQCDGNIARAARLTGLHRADLYRHLRQHRIKIDDFRAV